MFTRRTISLTREQLVMLNTWAAICDANGNFDDHDNALLAYIATAIESFDIAASSCCDQAFEGGRALGFEEGLNSVLDDEITFEPTTANIYDRVARVSKVDREIVKKVLLASCVIGPMTAGPLSNSFARMTPIAQPKP